MSKRWQIAQALEIRWWKNYLRKKDKAVYLRDKQQYWQKVLAKMDLQLKPGERVLDAGCGPAGIFIILDRQKVDALDPLLDQYAEQLDHFDPSAYPWVNFETRPLETIQVFQAYDKVFCLNVINHVADIDLCLDHLIAATVPNGYLLLAIDVHNYPLMKWLFRLIPGDVLHPHQHSLTDYKAMIAQRGGQVEKQLCWKKGFLFDFWFLLIRCPQTSYSTAIDDG